MANRIILTDRNCRITWQTPQAKGGDGAVGAYIWDLVENEDKEATKTAYSRCLTLGEHGQLVVRLDDRSGYNSLHIWPVSNGDVSLCTSAKKIDGRVFKLTDREREVLRLLGQGLDRRDIAKSLDLSTSTLDTYMSRARERLGLSQQTQLVIWASRHRNVL